MDYDVRFIAKHWEHHSTHSGYDQLANRLGSAIQHLNINRLRSKWIPGRIAVALAARSGNSLYSYKAFYDEWAATRDMLFHRRPSVYHVLYGDESYRYLGNFGKWRNQRIVATYHLPPSALRQYIHGVDYFKKLDGLIVVGRNQIPFFASIVGPKRVYFVPHGVDTHTFVPGCLSQQERVAERLCLFVGIHRRDFMTLRRVIEAVHVQDPFIKFVVVTSKANHPTFTGLESTSLMSDLLELELIQLYQNADLFLQPLEDSTANNAILEAMACGLPIIATDIGAVRDYVDEDCAILAPPHDAQAMANAVLCLHNNGVLRNQMATKARKRALQFDWSRIVEQTKQVYNQVLSS